MKNSKIIRNVARMLCVAVGCTAIAPSLIACCHDDEGGDGVKALVLATDILDTVFNPYFYTSGSDGEIVGQTQIGMLSSDKNGQPLSDWTEPCVSFDHSVVKVNCNEHHQINNNEVTDMHTEYYFALKDNIKFGDGTPLTVHDVLFNMYMFLDPAYTGSSTMYSVNIDGLTEYRLQTDASNAADANKAFANEVKSRFSALEDWSNNDNALWEDLRFFEPYKDSSGNTADADKVIESDIKTIQQYYMDSLNDAWRAAQGSNIKEEYVHVRYKDKDGNLIFKEPWEVFLYNYGIFTLTEHYDNDGKVDYSTPKNNYPYDDHSQEAVVNYVYNAKFNADDFAIVTDTAYADIQGRKDATKEFKKNLYSTMYSYAVYVPMYDYLLSAVKYRAFQGGMKTKNVRGIQILPNQTTIKKQDPNTLQETEVALKDANGNPTTCDVLKIQVNGIDPKAIQNFSFTVAPGHYYSNGDLWKKAMDENVYSDTAENFGVSFSNPDFMNSVKVKQLPCGAGPYRPAKADGGVATEKSQFSRNNMVYFESNPYFMLGEPKIKRLRYKVISSKDLYTTITETNEVHYASPSMKESEVTALATNTSVQSTSVDNLGYGYIGVSATYIPNIYIRKAIMASFNPDLIDDYYGSGASVITRPMSKTLVDYYYKNPADKTEYPRYYDEKGISEEQRKNNIKDWLDKAGCTTSGGKRYYGGQQLKYTFTIAGDSTDHPARYIFDYSAKLLNDLGLDITVKNDSMALSKLSSGLLTVWAAAWSSSSDPDMYQVYHKNSQATSTTAWGFKYIQSSQFKEPKYAPTAKPYNQLQLLDQLAAQIEAGRKSDVTSVRKEAYEKALDILMDFAVEFPTYQRNQYYIWKSGLFKTETLHLEEVGTYRSPLSRIWEVEMN